MRQTLGRAARALETAGLNHGQVEYLAQVYCLSLQAGSPVLLDDEEMERVREQIRDYGRQG